MQDYRHRPRKNTPHVVKAFDAKQGEYIGRIVDITADGMMLVTKQRYTVGRTFQIRVMLPVMVQQKTDITVQSRIIWCEADSSPGFFKTGFQFVNLAGEDGFLLEDVMHKLNLVG